ncbi:penicillin-binding transpeptidase domain-containing protein [Plantactinospora soyae]|uniref:Cell division protein FtsI/penicillin-binding protein 2 n=1 Tax=Plantactinospora soyae TaxID=1544732 RepID=A0A927M0N7_9ACTN|nr:penicillin-binding transpeptidase domain-containing protein [Plantactinospora soyae]MBE1484700.1 cell division protein FtsI/penicillin-binding protein 2 [Plantactinospora soyae]
MGSPYPSVRSRGRRPVPRRIAGTVAGLLLATGTLVGCSDSDGPDRAVDAFLAGWRGGDLNKVGFRNPAGERVPANDVAAELKELTGELAKTPPALRREGEAKITEGAATVTVRVDWTLPGDTHWTYPSEIHLKRGKDDDWQVIWEPKVIEPRLTSGDRLALRRLPAKRAQVVDGAGNGIVVPRPVVVVGVQPSEVSDVPALVRDLDRAFKAIRPPITPAIDLTDLPKRLEEAKPDAFVDVVSLRRDAYLQIKPRIYDLPGTKFRDEQRELAPYRGFAAALLGSVDPVQAADMEANPGLFENGDLIGHGGLQGRYDKQLRGGVGLSVIITTKRPDDSVTPTGTETFRQEPQAGAPLKTTLDVAAQSAADRAVESEKHRSAVVAVRISDGAVLAAANGASAENLAFDAQVPPGSTFKMVSTLGLLDAGAVTLDAPVACPKTFTVDGRSFKNSDSFALGTVPFRTDFAKSCNTAFAALAPKLGPDGLANAGRSLGLESSWQLGIDAFTGKVSAGGSAAERAAAAFGQGTTLVSPLSMAAATAAVARGQWQQPKLVLEPAPDQAAAPGPQLKAGSVEPLRAMMREVVTSGTGSALKDVPGKPVYGKTGTAEYDDNPAHTHAWFVGWQGDIAFAVFVEKGGSSTATAVPIAERFLRNLAAR